MINFLIQDHSSDEPKCHWYGLIKILEGIYDRLIILMRVHIFSLILGSTFYHGPSYIRKLDFNTRRQICTNVIRGTLQESKRLLLVFFLLIININITLLLLLLFIIVILRKLKQHWFLSVNALRTFWPNRRKRLWHESHSFPRQQIAAGTSQDFSLAMISANYVTIRGDVRRCFSERGNEVHTSCLFW